MRSHGSPLFSFYIATLSVLPYLTIAAGNVVDNGKVVTLNSVPYYVGGIAVAQISTFPRISVEKIAIPDADLTPLTVFHVNGTAYGAAELETQTTDFMRTDDVFQKAFLAAVYLAHSGNGSVAIDVATLEPTLKTAESGLLMVSDGLTTSKAGNATVFKSSLSKQIPNGPYFVSTKTGKVFKAYRLYPDDSLAFISGAVSDEAGGYLALPGVTENVMAKSIAVPSRLYYTVTPEKPLAGLRLGVKDIFHVKGVKTSGGNRAYFYLYGAQNATGPAIQRLLDQGAVFVGKMGTVQFANGDNPTADWVDLHCPFNPRGDGYQYPGGSSSGPGAGIAAYPWLDIAVGSDTGGSMRSPAGQNGIYGNRPSTGAISLDDVIPLSPVLDTAGVFARSADLWNRVATAWYTNFTSNFATYPKKVFYSPASSSSASTAAIKLLDNFASQLTAFLGQNSTLELVSIAKKWNETRTPSPPVSVLEMLNLTYAAIVSHDQYNLLAKPFFSAYGAMHNGEQPFINPAVLARWTWGVTNVDETVYQTAVRNASIFKTWWETAGYGKPDPDSCSEGLFLYPQSGGTASYRNAYFLGPSGPPLGFSDGRMPVFAGTPTLVVPLGEVPYNSTISGKTNYLPVTMSIVAARGCDLMLGKLAKELEGRGILRAVGTGARLYG